MKLNQPTVILGALLQPTIYTGKHRDLNMLRGVGLIPHGDRNRCKPEYGVDVVQDRDSDANIWRI